MDTTGLHTPPAYLVGGASYRQWVDALASITRAVNENDSERGVGDLIARSCQRLIGVDRVAVLIGDKGANALRLVGAAGLSPDYVEQVNNQTPIEIDPDPDLALVAGSPSSRAYRGRRSLSVADIRTNSSFAPWRESAEEEGFQSMFAAPLVTSKSTLGVLACYNDTVGLLTPAQRELTEMLADHAALAMESFQLRNEQTQAVERMTQAVQELRRDRRLHQDLMELVLEGGSVDDILQSASKSLGLLLEIDSNCRESDKRVAISVAGEHFGSIEADQKLDSQARRALESVGLVVALERQRLQVADEIGNRHATELLTEILTSNHLVDADELNDRALRLGFRLDLPNAVMVFRSDQPVPKIARRVAEIVRTAADGTHIHPIASYRGDVAVALLPEDADLERASSFLHSVVNQKITTTTVSSVLGPLTSAPDDLASSYRMATAVLKIRQSRHINGKLMRLNDTGTLGLLLSNVSEDTVRFSQSLLAPLTDPSNRASDSLLPTLRTYLLHNRSSLMTARKLSVHQNTVANRLDRISTLTNRSLENTEHLLDFSLALLIQDVLEVDESHHA
ncbi:helix-turn-helix domain-containing protein [Rhodococcus sp. ACS1]|uniref:helix-turn-helix domain-containing protein n=1 Tax=Rhodococcus sp. ACS1 TaxID=2028570 RepID=UPI001179D7DB|nr:helix-turn-helix domain-containing protein [Rhodococcus sp. ACS1]